MTDLTSKQERFVGEFLIDLCATAAAKRAGYSSKTAGQQGHELLKKPEIQTAIAVAQAKRSKQTGIKSEWVIERLVSIVDRSMQAVPVFDSEGNRTGEWTQQGNVAVRALELLGKHLGMFSDKHEVEHKGNINVTIKVYGENNDAQPDRELEHG